MMMVNEMGGSKEKGINQYSSGHNILLVGEGDFSFSLSLAMAFGSATNILATSLDSYDGLLNKYKNARKNVDNLESLRGTVLYGVDATNMADLPLLGLNKFDRIIFNFPHAGYHGTETSPHLIKMLMNLVRGFLSNASSMLCVDGEVHITHKTTAPFDSWRIVDLALESSLICIGCDAFDIKDYPGYHNKRGSGLQPDESFPVGASSTFKFKLNPAVVKENPRELPKVCESESYYVCCPAVEAMTLGFEMECYNRLPLFSVEDYGFWKFRMKTYLSTIHYEMLRVIEDGPIQIMKFDAEIGAQVPKPINEMTPGERQLSHLDKVAKNILITKVSDSTLSKLFSCKSAKDMWDTLAIMGEGTDQIKESRLRLAVHKFQHLRMLPEENIDMLDARFTSIMNDITLLGKEEYYTNREVALKILRSLPSRWKTKVLVMQSTRDLSKISTQELFSELKAFEFDLEIMEGSSSVTSNNTKSQEPATELKEQLAMMTQRFEKLTPRYIKYKKYYEDNKDKRNKYLQSSP